MREIRYIALTIGPIYRTLEMARATRELFAASYLFSNLMGELVHTFKNKGTLLIPSEEVSRIDASCKFKSGLFPDRMILALSKTQPISFDDSVSMVNDIKEAWIKKHFNTSKNFSFDLLNNYFQTHLIEIRLNEHEDPVHTILPLLDTMEQRAAIVEESEIALNTLLTDSHLYKYLSKEKIIPLRFPSIPEIAVADLFPNHREKLDKIFSESMNEEISDQELKRKIKDECKKEYKFYHNYIAIVVADVDDLQRLIRAFIASGRGSSLQSFSKQLMEFGKKAAETIAKKSGVPVYCGGDDLLLIMPVKLGTETIFDIILKLDEEFRENMLKNPEVAEVIATWNSGVTRQNRRKLLQIPTISWGVALSYKKYPLSEALESARSLLMDSAKKVAEKNGIAFRLLKHSGHHIGTTMSKGWRSWKLFNALICHQLDEKEPDRFLSSIQYKLEPLRPLLTRILTGRIIKDSDNATFPEKLTILLPQEVSRELMLKNTVDNFFNEISVHKISKEFIYHVFELLLQAYRDMEDYQGNSCETADGAINLVYACLRCKQFFEQPDKDIL